MNPVAKLLTIVLSLLLCVGGSIWSGSKQATSSTDEYDFDRSNARANEIYAVSDGPLKLSLNEIESIIRHDRTTKGLRGSVDFGSVTVLRGAVIAEVLFRNASEPSQKFVCTLRYKSGAWYVAAVSPQIESRADLRI